jgi:hypothetical protein
MIMGDICTRRCPFTMWARPPVPLDREPENLARTIAALGSGTSWSPRRPRRPARRRRAFRRLHPRCARVRLHPVEVLVPDARRSARARRARCSASDVEP